MIIINAHTHALLLFHCLSVSLSLSLLSLLLPPLLVPPTITRDPTDVIVIRNNSFSLDCSAFGSPTPNITWLKGGMALSPSNLINIVSSSTSFTRTSLLTVYHSSFSDSEDYMCLAENSLVALISKNSSIATITVNREFM